MERILATDRGHTQRKRQREKETSQVHHNPCSNHLCHLPYKRRSCRTGRQNQALQLIGRNRLRQHYRHRYFTTESPAAPLCTLLCNLSQWKRIIRHNPHRQHRLHQALHLRQSTRKRICQHRTPGRHSLQRRNTPPHIKS